MIIMMVMIVMMKKITKNHTNIVTSEYNFTNFRDYYYLLDGRRPKNLAPPHSWFGQCPKVNILFYGRSSLTLKCCAFNLNYYQTTLSKYLENLPSRKQESSTQFSSVSSQHANSHKSRFATTKTPKLPPLGNYQYKPCMDKDRQKNNEISTQLSKFVEKTKICEMILLGKKKCWVLLMRRELDIFSEIRLRCASGCKPKLWKFEWILNWRGVQI